VDSNIVGAYPLQNRLGIGALYADLAEGAHVEQPNAGAHGHVLGSNVRMPARPRPCVVGLGPTTLCRLLFRKEPVGSLPAGCLAEIGTRRGKLLVHRAVTGAARG